MFTRDDFVLGGGVTIDMFTALTYTVITVQALMIL